MGVRLNVKPGVSRVDHRSRDLLGQMHLFSSAQFKGFCISLFEALGYIVQSSPASGERGVDLELHKDGRLTVVRCWRQESAQAAVGEAAVKDFCNVVSRRGADTGIFCTNGYFSTRAKAWAAGTCIELMDGAEIARLWSVHTDAVFLGKGQDAKGR
jgi:restriction endonuclease Mrr